MRDGELSWHPWRGRVGKEEEASATSSGEEMGTAAAVGAGEEEEGFGRRPDCPTAIPDSSILGRLISCTA